MSKREDHVLVTSGVFSYVRHPSYVGWFLWSLGTQVVLLNPICFVLYTGVTWTFFNERIYAEEYLLLRFFGNAYSDYQAKVPAGIPFIRGFFFDKDKSNWMFLPDLSSTRTCHAYQLRIWINNQVWKSYQLIVQAKHTDFIAYSIIKTYKLNKLILTSSTFWNFVLFPV